MLKSLLHNNVMLDYGIIKTFTKEPSVHYSDYLFFLFYQYVPIIAITQRYLHAIHLSSSIIDTQTIKEVRVWLE